MNVRIQDTGIIFAVTSPEFDNPEMDIITDGFAIEGGGVLHVTKVGFN